MDPLTSLYVRLHSQTQTAPPAALYPEPPRLEDWLRYWDDNETDLGNLRNFEHWLSRAVPSHPANR
jgi:hypothetical protein